MFRIERRTRAEFKGNIDPQDYGFDTRPNTVIGQEEVLSDVELCRSMQIRTGKVMPELAPFLAAQPFDPEPGLKMSTVAQLHKEYESYRVHRIEHRRLAWRLKLFSKLLDSGQLRQD